jgi:hypothetical protein
VIAISALNVGVVEVLSRSFCPMLLVTDLANHMLEVTCTLCQQRNKGRPRYRISVNGDYSVSNRKSLQRQEGSRIVFDEGDQRGGYKVAKMMCLKNGSVVRLLSILCNLASPEADFCSRLSSSKPQASDLILEITNVKLVCVFLAVNPGSPHL